MRIATADRMDAREGLLREIALSAAAPFGIAMAGSLVLLWIGVGRGLAPIERVRTALLNRRADADAPLLAIDAPPELQPPNGFLAAHRSRDDQGRPGVTPP